MMQHKQFKQAEQDNNGRLKYILCPHLEALGGVDRRTRLFNLIDNSEQGTVTLGLCGVCAELIKAF